MQSVLLTGFGPFKEHGVNPSQLIAERLNGETIAGAVITSLILPVAFGMDTDLVFPAIKELRPVLVLSLGLNAGTDSLDVEMFAINHRYGDSEHDLLPIIDNAPAAYFASIDLDYVVKAAVARTQAPIRKHGYAGSYLCNHIFYQTLHFIASHQMNCKVGFIHIPYSTEQLDSDSVNTPPSLPLDLMTDGIRVVIEEALLPSTSGQ